MALVSVIIPTYNRAHCLGRAVCSVLSQSFRDVELVVVDDGSEDDTDDALAPFRADERMKVVKHNKNRGALAAMNTGFDHATAPWLSLLGSDDELLPNAIQKLVDVVRQYGNGGQLGTVIGNCLNTTDNQMSGRGLTADGWVSYEDFLCGRVAGEFWGVFSRAILGDRRFDINLRGGFESILWFEFYRHSKTYYVHASLRIYHRGLSDALSGFDNLCRDAEKISHCYTRILDTRGTDLLRHCSARYAYFARRKAFFSMLAGHRAEGIAWVARAIRHEPNIEVLGLAALSLLPRRGIIEVARRWYERRMAGTKGSLD